MEKLHIFQKGFNYSQDGPGNRLVYHLSGCSLHCPWCSNPEGKSRNGGGSFDIETILAEAISCKPMFFENGGVTFTGGEATEQFDALNTLLSHLKNAGITTCIETNGTHPRLPELFPVIDYLLMDCKHYDDVRHKKVIGVSNRTIYSNIVAACAQRAELSLRIPLIGGFNASPADAHGFLELFQKAGAAQLATVELLRYHEYGKDKWTQCSMEYKMSDANLTDEEYGNFVSVLKKNGISIIKT